MKIARKMGTWSFMREENATKEEEGDS